MQDKLIKSPEWATNCPNWIVSRILQDLSFYKGLEIKVQVLCIKEVGEAEFEEAFPVIVGDIFFATFNSPWVDTNYSIILPKESEIYIRQNLVVIWGEQVHGEKKGYYNEELDPYMLGFAYEIDERYQQIISCYRGWERQG
jgi:hypothetical protein